MYTGFCFEVYSSPVIALPTRSDTDFVRSGNVNLNTGALRNFGINGYDWSRIATVYGAGTWDAKAYNLNFNASGVNPSNNNVRWNGFPVRLFYRGSVPIFSAPHPRARSLALLRNVKLKLHNIPLLHHIPLTLSTQFTRCFYRLLTT